MRQPNLIALAEALSAAGEGAAAKFEKNLRFGTAGFPDCIEWQEPASWRPSS